jgi:hypothetical protein
MRKKQSTKKEEEESEEDVKRREVEEEKKEATKSTFFLFKRNQSSRYIHILRMRNSVAAVSLSGNFGRAITTEVLLIRLTLSWTLVA